MTEPRTISDRAVSDVVAFVLTFGIIISGVTIVYIGGVGALGDLRENEQVNSGERSMRGVAETMEDIHRKNVPGRSVEIGVDGGQIDLVDSSMTFTVEFASRSPESDTIDVNALVYQPSSGDTRLVYEGGAVIRDERQGFVMTHPPVFDCSDAAALVSVPRLDGDISVSTGGNLELFGERDSSNTGLHLPEGNPSNVETVTVDVSDTAVPDSWSRYFEREGWTDEGGGEYSCEGDGGGLERGYVRRTTIELRTLL
ncbi:DUF7289 family protein [Halorientalis halophila]|uniref:DUF7289 family protein n=1 Tax=Halorientalis halophila TaxID=3108499 RepID=UPI0030081A02